MGIHSNLFTKLYAKLIEIRDILHLNSNKSAATPGFPSMVTGRDVNLILGKNFTKKPEWKFKKLNRREEVHGENELGEPERELP